ncbi:hypothetical protein [Reichenbachiella ulvae]|uniref:LVIVD repeat-containing protein n=1 Tax=Reichenbachiella ulvae TaxID=2980104 RepID=A0ABT3CQG0_9BACT|nr:hypothetical protein [Reichenbachiella ulvae]MCV9385889.1 hypothetical protein [Reichenbachiella ulvae]
MIKKTIIVLSIVLSIGLNSCDDYEYIPEFDVRETEGYKPIYSQEVSLVEILDARPFTNPGNITKYGRLILINENNQGFHIIDNTDPSQPVKSGFFVIPYNNNIAVKDNVVYADSGSDLLAIEIMQDGSLSVNRSGGVFGDLSGNLPPETGVYFECVENENGVVVGWERTTLYNPQCYY